MASFIYLIMLAVSVDGRWQHRNQPAPLRAAAPFRRSRRFLEVFHRCHRDQPDLPGPLDQPDLLDPWDRSGPLAPWDRAGPLEGGERSEVWDAHARPGPR